MITPGARALAHRGRSEYFINADGGFSSAPLDRTGESEIGLADWLGAKTVAEERTRLHQGDDRADRLAVHHNLVIGLIPDQSLPVALAYDIKARELSAKDARHDLAVLDSRTLGRAFNEHMLRASHNRGGAAPSPPRAARPTPYSRPGDTRTVASGATPLSAQQPCFRCGGTGHFTAACTAKSTSAGKPCASMFRDAGRGKVSPQSLASPSDPSRAFCLSWARTSTCRHGAGCAHFHGCSVCTDTSHGAASCPRLA